MAQPPRTVTQEGALLRDVRQFMRATARQLAALIPPARALRRKLERTERYRRVAGRDDAESEPAFDLAGTLGVMLERDLRAMVAYLRNAARGAERAARLRTERKTGDHGL